MGCATAKAREEPGTEYAVYVYHRPENQIEGQSDWEMRSVSKDLRSALYEAQRLFDSSNFKKVEIKHRVKNSRTKAVYDYTFKVLERGAGYRRARTALFSAGVVFGALMLAVLAAFALSVT